MTYIISCIVAENLKSDAPRVRASAAHCPVCVSGGVRGALGDKAMPADQIGCQRGINHTRIP